MRLGKATIAFLLIRIGGSLFADGGTADGDLRIIPLAGYEVVNFGSQRISAPTAGLVLNKNGGEIPEEDSLLTIAMYRQDYLEESVPGIEERRFHSVDLVFDRWLGGNEVLFVFKSAANEPVVGGIQTFQAGISYGRVLFEDAGFSLALGAGVFVGDFGLELPGGRPLIALPLPIAHIKYGSDVLDASFDYVASPNLACTLFPKDKLRLTGSLRMDQFRDFRDLIFDCAAMYRFFDADGPLGDFAGVAFGLKNEYRNFSMDEKDEFGYQYYAAYCSLDATVLKLTSGYAFGGREFVRASQVESLDRGFFITLEGLYQF